ncbi:MAG TPA: hypothetical protein VH599_00185, partial [Ktedonobacterales bacterium]
GLGSIVPLRPSARPPSDHICEPCGLSGPGFPDVVVPFSPPLVGRKGESLMVSSHASIPWYNLPPRAFPAKAWLENRYPFRVSPAFFIQPRGRATPAAASGRCEFPAKRWLAEQQQPH